MHNRIDEYLDILQDNTQKHFTKHYPTLSVPAYQVVEGRKYTKVIQVENDGSHVRRVIHSFVDKDGNVYKPAGWNAPAKGVRYNLATDMTAIQDKADPFGSYLYVR